MNLGCSVEVLGASLWIGGGGFPRCLGPSQLFSAIFTALG